MTMIMSEKSACPDISFAGFQWMRFTIPDFFMQYVVEQGFDLSDIPWYTYDFVFDWPGEQTTL